MAMVSSASGGQISLAGSATGPGSTNRSMSWEFKGTTTSQTSLSEYYRGGTYVANHPWNAPVATTGAITIGSFYGASKRYVVSVSITSNTSNYNFQTSSVSGYTAGWTDATLVINSGVTVSASAAGGTALTVTGFNSADTVAIQNSGIIQGGGGTGGAATGSAGGHAIDLTPASNANVYVSNLSGATIAGGGGGGGRGMAVYGYYVDNYFNPVAPVTYMRGGGGGGGAGNPVGSGSAAVGSAQGTYYNYLISATAGGAGSSSAGGGGGNGDGGYVNVLNNYYLMYAGAGGPGGGQGASGSGGNQGYLNGPPGVVYIPTTGSATAAYPGSGVYGVMQSGSNYGSGGAAGYAVKGTNKLAAGSISNSGSVYGPQGT